MRQRLQRRVSRDERGFTLIELLVVMLIMGIVGSVVASGVIQGLRTSSRAESRIVALTDLQRGVERVAREIRVANPMCLVAGQEDTRVGAVVFRDGKRYRYEYYVQGSGADEALLQDVTVFDPPSSTTGTVLTSGVFVAEIANDTLGLPLLQYANNNGLPIEDANGDGHIDDQDGDGNPEGTYATAAQVTLNLTKQVRDADPVVVSTTVEIRNTRYGSAGGGC